MRGIKTDWGILPIYDEPLHKNYYKLWDEQIDLLRCSKEKLMIIPSTPSRGINLFYKTSTKAKNKE